MSLARKIRRQGLAKQRKIDRAHYGTCDAPLEEAPLGCELDATSEHVCLTCEALVAAGKKGKGPDGGVFRRKVCPLHRGAALEAVKRHALSAHPVNMLKMAVAVLKGDA